MGSAMTRYGRGAKGISKTCMRLSLWDWAGSEPVSYQYLDTSISRDNVVVAAEMVKGRFTACHNNIM